MLILSGIRLIAMLVVFVFTIALFRLTQKKSQNKITMLEFRKKALIKALVIVAGLLIMRFVR